MTPLECQKVVDTAQAGLLASRYTLRVSDRALRVVIDDHVFDKLEADTEQADLLTRLIVEGKIVVLMPRVFQDQLRVRSNGRPSWVPIHDIPDVTTEANVLVSDDARYRSHAEGSGRFEALTYDEFTELLKLLRLGHEGSL